MLPYYVLDCHPLPFCVARASVHIRMQPTTDTALQMGVLPVSFWVPVE